MPHSSDHDPGLIQVLVERLNTQRLPCALDLKKKVDGGATLSDFDMRFLEDVFADAQKIRPLIERHPEYQDLVTRVIHLYKEILDKATNNENKA
ncbi:MAG: hypothetical protein J5I92_05625 [Thiogranum sp.]|nr:hypothetical protein [Thiogranum sp.]